MDFWNDTIKYLNDLGDGIEQISVGVGQITGQYNGMVQAINEMAGTIRDLADFMQFMEYGVVALGVAVFLLLVMVVWQGVTIGNMNGKIDKLEEFLLERKVTDYGGQRDDI